MIDEETLEYVDALTRAADEYKSIEDTERLVELAEKHDVDPDDLALMVKRREKREGEKHSVSANAFTVSGEVTGHFEGKTYRYRYSYPAAYNYSKGL